MMINSLSILSFSCGILILRQYKHPPIGRRRNETRPRPLDELHLSRSKTAGIQQFDDPQCPFSSY